MVFGNEPRVRLNASQTAKNLWKLEVTVENKSEHIEISNDPNDPGNTVRTHLGLQALSVIKETEATFRRDGRKMVGDYEE